MSGETEYKTDSNTPEGKQLALDAVLDRYEKSLGLRDNVTVNEADKYLNLSVEEIRRMDSDECGEAYYILQRYGMFLQREHNKEKSHVKWAERTLNNAVVTEIDQFQGKSYSTFEERKLKTIKSSGYLVKLDKLLLLAELRVQKLDFLSSSVHRIAQAILEIRGLRGNKK